MEKTLAVDTGDWREFPGSEQDKIDLVLQKLAARQSGEVVEVIHLEPVTIPEIMYQIEKIYPRGSITAIVSNMGGCACGKCDDRPMYYVLVVSDEGDDAMNTMRARASAEDSVMAEDVTDEHGNINPGQFIAKQIAKMLSDRFGGEVDVREMSIDEMGDLGIDVGMDGSINMGRTPQKRTVH